MLQYEIHSDNHYDWMENKTMAPVFQFLDSRSYVFKQLGVGCFIKVPLAQDPPPLELHLYLQKKGRPLLYKDSPLSMAVILLHRSRPRPFPFPWLELDSYATPSQYVTDAFNRILEHYQHHTEGYRPATDDEMAAITWESDYLVLLTPETP